jgi:hypothetical protein
MISQIDGLTIVRSVAAQYPALLQTNTNASCYQFTTHVLERLQAEGYVGWGYVGKTAGEGQYTPPSGFPQQVGGYTLTGVSHDAIGCADQRVDLLGNGNDGSEPLGSPAVAQWLDIPPANWRPNNPIVPFGGSVTPPALVFPPYPGDPVFDQIGVALFADYSLAGQPPNPGMGRWFGRTVYDYLAGMPIEKSIEKHRAEWKAVLGLP